MSNANSESLAPQANRLYWETERPAAELANELGISRSKFYALIEPLEAGTRCTRCDGRLEFANRTDRESGLAVCADCGATATAPDRREAASARDPGFPADLDRLADRLPSPASALLVAGAAGALIGFLTGAWLRRR